MVYDEVKARRKDHLLQPLLLNIPNQNPDEVELLDVPPEAFESDYCLICMQKEKDSIFYPCGH